MEVGSFKWHQRSSWAETPVRANSSSCHREHGVWHQKIHVFATVDSLFSRSSRGRLLRPLLDSFLARIRPKHAQDAMSDLNESFKNYQTSLFTGCRLHHSPGFWFVVRGKHCRTSSRNRAASSVVNTVPAVVEQGRILVCHLLSAQCRLGSYMF